MAAAKNFKGWALFGVFAAINATALAIALGVLFVTGGLTGGKLGEIISILRSEHKTTPRTMTELEKDLLERERLHQEEVRRFEAYKQKQMLSIKDESGKWDVIKQDLDRQRQEMDDKIKQFNQEKADFDARRKTVSAQDQQERLRSLVKTFEAMEPEDIKNALVARTLVKDSNPQVYVDHFSNEEIRDILLLMKDVDFRGEIIAEFLNDDAPNSTAKVRGQEVVKLIAK